MGKKIWNRPAAKPVSAKVTEDTLTPAEVAEVKERIAELDTAIPFTPEPVAAPVAEPPKPAPIEYKMGYNAEKMRQSCGKCKGTQLLLTDTLWKDGPGGPDGKPTKVKDGFEFTCNDCKTTYRGK